MISRDLIKFLTEKYYINIQSDGFDTIQYFDEIDDSLSPNEVEKKPNPYHSWQDVPFDYLNYHFTGITPLTTLGFLFYTPAIITCLLDDVDERNNSVAISWWLYKLQRDVLENQSFDCIQSFNQEQLLILILFLEFLSPFEIVKIQDLNNIISSLESFILTQKKEEIL